MNNWTEVLGCYSFVLHACQQSGVGYDRVSFGDFVLPSPAQGRKRMPYVQVHILAMNATEQEAFKNALWVNGLRVMFMGESLQHDVQEFLIS